MIIGARPTRPWAGVAKNQPGEITPCEEQDGLPCVFGAGENSNAYRCAILPDILCRL